MFYLVAILLVIVSPLVVPVAVTVAHAIDYRRKGAGVRATAIRDFVKARVAGYKYPRRIWFVDELPQGPTSKIRKRDIVIPVEA
jgi:acyl-coenzyme A synthetase/AMP-(fatty) acid ligase